MDEEDTDAAWANQEQMERQERQEREEAAIRSARPAQAELRKMNREFTELLNRRPAASHERK